MKKVGIYRITNLINNKVYIGQSIDIDTRWQMHKYHAFNYNSQHHLHKAFRKYGIENFLFEVIKETYDLDYWEKFLISIHKSQDPKYGYNYQPGGEGGWVYLNNMVKLGKKKHGMTGYIWTEEQRKRMSDGRKNKFCGKDHYLCKMSTEERKKFLKEKSSFTAPWWNNGIIQKRSKTSPGPEWKRGTLKRPNSGEKVRGTKWYNNGIIAVRAKICPDGFRPGRLQKN